MKSSKYSKESHKEKNYQIFQQMRGFIANSSGSAYFQFYLIESERNQSIVDLFNDLGFRYGSIAHVIFGKIGVIQEFMETVKFNNALRVFLASSVPDRFYGLDHKVEGIEIDSLMNSEKNYYTNWVGFDEEGFNEKDDLSLGFLYMLKLEEKSSTKLIHEQNYIRTY